MELLKYLFRLGLIFSIPGMAIPPCPGSVVVNENQPNIQIQNAQPLLNYDDIIDLIIAIDEEALEERCDSDQIEKIGDFLSLLAMQGVDEEDIDGRAVLQQDIYTLQYETKKGVHFLAPYQLEDIYWIQSAEFFGKADLVLCKSWVSKQCNHLKKFVKKHKTAIIIGAAIVVAVAATVVAVSIFSAEAVVSSTVALASAASRFSIGESDERCFPQEEAFQKHFDLIQNIEEIIPIIESPDFANLVEERSVFLKSTLIDEVHAEDVVINEINWSLAEKARELGSCVAHEILDAAAALGSFLPQLQAEAVDVSSKLLPEGIGFSDLPNLTNRDPVECYEDTILELHQMIDKAFSTDQSELYTPEGKSNDPTNDFTIGILPPPSMLGEIFNNNSLLAAGKVVDRAGFTRAGRAWMKHGNREGSVFPKPFGNPTIINEHGQMILEEILNDPGREVFKISDGGFKIYSSNGRGACFKKDGTFKGFIERQYE